MTDAEPGSRLTISDIPQDEPVPSASASSCADSGDVALVLPEVSAGDSVTDTVAKLSSACLQVQYASEAADVSEGSVTRVVVPMTVPDGSVQLPPTGDGSPGPGDKVKTSAVWVQLLLQSGDTGWVTATALSGDPETVVPTLCGTELSD
ncbi:hypothetical protein [Streptomyces sp. NPDC087859]|uniref:hypothetical protein n=1 Tax=Streptomyces sp. NPDC087859 TaxID=3365812 RepID=UPI0037F99256